MKWFQNRELSYNKHMDKQYLPRIIDKIIEESFEVIRALCIEGIKYCGKTSTCEHIANTVFKFQDIYKKEIYKSYIFTGNEILFNSPSPTLYDEWQEIPEI
jgi:predicted AAA+ superfamily ATPase